MSYELLIGDCRQRLADLPTGSIQTCITSPPYFGLRDYGMADQIGLEQTPAQFVAELVAVFREVKRTLKDDGTLWLNIGDSYNASPGQRKTTDAAGAKQVSNAGSPGAPSRNVEGLAPKNLIGIPWRLAFALQDDGWYLRQDIIWHKPNPMPESVTDRCTKAHEYIFLLSKSPKYYYDADAVKEPSSTFALDSRAGKGSVTKTAIKTANNADRNDGGIFCGINETRNKRSVWTVATAPYAEAHFATYPPALVLPCVLAGSRPGDTVLDPFNGAGTTGLVALENGRQYVGIELNPEYAALTRQRLARVQVDMFRSQPITA